MTDIYEQHQKAFAQVSAFVICRKGEKVATVAIKFPADGAGRLYAYVHFLGTEMARAYAGGYGYDKRSAAVAEAVKRISIEDASTYAQDLRDRGHDRAALAEDIAHVAKRERVARFKAAFSDIGGQDWTRALESAGYDVMQAV